MSPSSYTLKQSLSAGFAGAVDFWSGTLFNFFASVVSVVLDLTWPVLLVFLFLQPPVGIGALFAFLGLLWFLVQWVKGHLAVMAIERAHPYAFEGSPSFFLSLKWVVGSLPVEVLLSAWKTLAILSAGGAYIHSLASGHTGMLSSMALAFALLVSLPLAFLLEVWKRVAWVHGISTRQGIWAGFFDAAGILAHAAWPFIRLSLVCSVLVFAASMTVSPFGNAVRHPGGELLQGLAIVLAGQFVVAIVLAFVSAFIDMAQLFAYAQLLKKPTESSLPQAELLPEATFFEQNEPVGPDQM